MKDFLKNIRFVWKYSKSEKGKIIVYLINSFIRAGIGVIFPIISAKIIVSLTDNLLEQCLIFGGVMALLEILFDTLHTITSKLYTKIFRQIYINIQSDLGAEILKLNNKTLEENGSGLFIQRLTGDTRSISRIFTDLNDYISQIFSSIGILSAYFIISKEIFFFVIVALIIRMIIDTKRIKVYNENDKHVKELNDKLTGFTSEIVRGAEDIKMLNGEESFLKELKARFSIANEESYKRDSTNYSYRYARMVWSDFSFFLVLALIVLFVKTGKLETATALVLYNYGGRYNNLAFYITGIQETIKSFNLSASRIFDIYEDKKYEKEKFGTKHLDKVNGDFEFKDVTFKYDKNKVLDNISFKVNANETVAFVGKSGSGKTTIFNLLCKMYDGYKGKITIDNNDIKELDKDTIRGNITIVSQSPYIFNMSIKENLKLVKENLTDKEMKEACKMACLDDYIESLPDKYNTIVGEGGINLSGGQKQRLAIARAFVQKTEIILFDEATSALDNETQQKIQQAIDNLQKDYTILIIAHRLSTIKNADRILVLDKGKIIAEGKHEKLLKSCKEYKELYNTEITKIDKQ